MDPKLGVGVQDLGFTRSMLDWDQFIDPAVDYQRRRCASRDCCLVVEPVHDDIRNRTY